ncbi:DegT/DnrJ/EryC1/StrS family aminotransferase [Candidatus Gottesmanbacteria bacterium]|nr:DegT/DnrJ/EryC1/StrS family aminotransferase [Candidatus Gottesmanbacteria bacterium]
MKQKRAFIPIAHPDLHGNEAKYVESCLSSSWISSKGNFITKFEEQFAKYIGTKYAIAVSNGTVALHLSLVGLGIGKGDEVLIPDLTFVATANAVTFTGATPVFIDVDDSSWGISPQMLEKKVTKHTKAIIVVHLYGRPADMESIIPIAQKFNLKIIEDAAEAHGAEVSLKNKNKTNWKKVGSIGDVGCFSFYGNKIITTGEGGMITTNNSSLVEKMRMLRNHGQDLKRQYYHSVVGFNYRMTNIQAALGCAQLERIDQFLQKRVLIAQKYTMKLKDIPGIIPHPRKAGERSVYWMYSILVRKPYSLTSDKLMKNLGKENIETRPFFYPLHILPPYRMKGEFPVSNYLSRHGVSLPSSVFLRNEEIEVIAAIIRKYA